MREVIADTAEAIRERSERTVDSQAQRIRYAEVLTADPLTAELADGGLVLDEDNLVTPLGVLDEAPERGDNILVVEVDDEFLALGSMTDADLATRSAIRKKLIDAKGDLIAGTADNAVDRLAVGTDGWLLTADSAEPTGLKWAAHTAPAHTHPRGDLPVEIAYEDEANTFDLQQTFTLAGAAVRVTENTGSVLLGDNTTRLTYLTAQEGLQVFASSDADYAVRAKGPSPQNDYRFLLDVTGKMTWGSGTTGNRDTNLYRSAANTLATDDTLEINQTGAALRFPDDASWLEFGDSVTSYAWMGVGGLYVEPPSLGFFLVANVWGDTQGRYIVKHDGLTEWGDGTAARDTNLYRDSANVLKTDDDFTVLGGLSVNSTVTQGSHLGTGISSAFWVKGNSFLDAGTASTVALTLKRRTSQTADIFQVVKESGSTHKMVGIDEAGTLQWADQAGGAWDTNLYRSAAQTLKTPGDLHLGDGLYLGSLGGTAYITGSGDYPYVVLTYTGSATGASAGSGIDFGSDLADIHSIYAQGDSEGLRVWNEAGPTDILTFSANAGGTALPGIFFGGNTQTGASARDTNLYRSAAGRLNTDGSFHARGDDSSGAEDEVLKLGQIVGSPATQLYAFSTADDTDGLRIDCYRWSANVRWSRGSSTGQKEILLLNGSDGGHELNLYSGDPANNNVRVRLDAAGAAENPALLFADAAGAFDTNLYRSAANALKTDDALWVVGNLQVDADPSTGDHVGNRDYNDARYPASSHTHAQADVTNLVTDLAAKAPLASPALTGDPTAPTPTAADNDTSIATTAFVKTVAGGKTYLPAAIAYEDEANTFTANQTINADLLLGTGGQVDFAEDVGDKLLLYSNSYGIGIEASTLTTWSSVNHRWRVGGTSVSTGTEEMLLTVSTLDLKANTLTNLADPTDDAHVGDRAYNDARYPTAFGGYISVYDSTGGQTSASTTLVTLNLDTTLETDGSVFSLASDQVTCNVDGVMARVTYEFSWSTSGANAGPRAWLYLNGVAITGTRSQMFQANGFSGVNHMTALVALDDGDYLDIRFSRYSGTGTVTTTIETGRLTVQQVAA